MMVAVVSYWCWCEKELDNFLKLVCWLVPCLIFLIVMCTVFVILMTLCHMVTEILYHAHFSIHMTNFGSSKLYFYVT